ncbi:MAG: PqqD family peptide modification chaperone [Thermodesulfobacteriota bacterium]|nr:PqqD family peptide modification chaperone [Thermodesulfobacteriota bacterium]
MPFFVYSSERAKKNHILFHATRPHWMVINDTGLEVALLLEKTGSVEKSAESLARKYGISNNLARKDVSSVYDLLNGQGFLDRTTLVPQSREPSLKTVFFHLTKRCNLKCPHCYLHQGDSADTDLPFPVVIGLLDALMENGGKSITLSGGEPLLYPGIKEVIEYARRGLEVKVLTNGVLIDREWAEFFAGMDVSVQISIDGSGAEVHDSIRGHGTFEKSMQALKHLQKAGLGHKVNFSTTVMKQNLHDLPKIISLAEKYSVPLVRFLPLRRRGRAESEWASVGSELTNDDYLKFFRYTADLRSKGNPSLEISCGLSGFLLRIPEDISKDDIWCPVGGSLIVDTNGDTYPCVLMMDDEFKVGNVCRDTPLQIIQSGTMKMVSGMLTERRSRIEKCALCPWRNLCQSGCMGQTLEHKGTVWDTDDFCDYRREEYSKAFERILKI